MLIWPDCILCTLKMAFSVARTALHDDARLMRFMKETLSLECLAGDNLKITAPEIVRDVWVKLIELTGDPDPLRELKNEQNRSVLQLYPGLKEAVKGSDDPLREAVRLSIAGNAIDTMAEALSKSADRMVADLADQQLDPDDFEAFRDRLARAKSIVYLGDNCGEIVFDRIVIETINGRFGKKVVFVTRTIPVMNDATLADARAVGLEQVAELVENGIAEPLAGTMLAKVSPEVRKLIDDADLVILKGGGNYDCMTEEASIHGRASFLFQAKCHPFSVRHRVPLGSLVVYNA
jgi:uncharacterized protein with ATP-grasp and redox domains